MLNPKKSSKIPFLLATLVFLILALIFAVLFIFYAYSGDDADSSDNTVTYGGQTYKTVKIGEQVWFAENLNYDEEGSKCYDNNPDNCPKTWMADKARGSVCYEKYSANCAKYGRLYDWETAMKVCPKGWHLPSNAEWDKLYRFVDGDTGTESPYESETAERHLKAFSGWKNPFESPNAGDAGERLEAAIRCWRNGGKIRSSGSDFCWEDVVNTDKYGFSALPGGYGNSVGSFGNVGIYGNWWSATEIDPIKAYYRYMYYGYSNVHAIDYYKSSLYSVRCVQD